jgi:hypothetical protein
LDPFVLSSTPHLLPILLAGCILVILITSMVAAQASREARSTIFPVVREEQTIIAKRARLIIAFLSFVTGCLAAIWIISGGPARDFGSGEVAVSRITATPTKTVPVTATPTQPTTAGKVAPAETKQRPATPTPLPTPTVVPVSLPVATSTSLPQEEASPTPLPPATVPTETTTPSTSAADLTSARPAGPEASIGPITIARGIENKEPVEPGTVFELDNREIYAIFPYNGMHNGVRWAISWSRDEQDLGREESLWEYGSKDVAWRIFLPTLAGKYKVTIYIEDRAVASAPFEMQEPAIGGPQQ